MYSAKQKSHNAITTDDLLNKFLLNNEKTPVIIESSTSKFFGEVENGYQIFLQTVKEQKTQQTS
jgi:hypothetical protein